MGKVKIRNLKSINMDFELPATKGVYLLVGRNGTGKSTLLVCLHRICDSYSFAYNLRPARVPDIDQFKNSAITYSNGVDSITYKKRGTRWTASPRHKVGQTLSSFGYENSILIKADSKRIDPPLADLNIGVFDEVSDEIKHALNTIFETEKYNNLKRLKNSHGRGQAPTFFYVLVMKGERFSEKRFSSGELAIIRLLESLSETKNNSLVLLDEAEMALHPRVQARLMQYLKTRCEEKNLTAIVSTHSPTLINDTNPSSIILLEERDASIDVSYWCYPAKAIGVVGSVETSGFDYHFFVEDVMAKKYLQYLIERFFTLSPKHMSASINIVPVGGFQETAKLAIYAKGRNFAGGKVFAALDTDAFATMDNSPTSTISKLCKKNKDTVFDLGCTPEMWFIEQLESGSESIDNLIKDEYHCEGARILNSENYLACSNENSRKLAKNKFKVFISDLAEHSGKTEEAAQDSLIQMLINNASESYVLGAVKKFFR